MIQRTQLACRLSKPQNCLGLDRGPHLGQRTWCRVNRPDTCSHSTRPSEFSSKLLHPRGRPHMHAETHTIGNSVSDHPTNTARQLAFSLVRRPITPLRIGRI